VAAGAKPALTSTGSSPARYVAGGERIGARRAVICNVTPTQLYGELLGGTPPPFRYGRSEMQIHFAPSGRRSGRDERLAQTAIVHLTPGLDGVSRAVNEADRGLLPAEATVVVGQPLTMDPSRAPAGKGLLWVQLQELPWQVKGDAAGELDAGDGVWTAELRERYADRIRRIAQHVPNERDREARRASPADLWSANVNPGAAIRRSLRARPETSSGAPHRTHEWRLARRRIDPSGLTRRSGALVAQQLLEPPLTK
jgi:phytoene dehydrogenase-like protein